ncbi:hypothetical protein GWI33_018152 [Rhynchophorus ferrugineus]|uniref:RING finger protein 17 n=1 Tax=Rhynchophorus ferrugineus TaxID=354439 RepID=A0A834HWR1_RHYFE|nr:hypothetical protein GWI33_018152 [Rhynchophorus ferrugineus]
MWGDPTQSGIATTASYNVSQMQHKKTYKQNKNQTIPPQNYNNPTNTVNITEPEPQGIISPDIYFCFKCKKGFTCRYSPSKNITGKVPLILHCNHTICQDCIYNNLKDFEVTCPICNRATNLDQKGSITTPKDLQSVLLPNYYIIGYILFNESQYTHSIKFVSNSLKKTSTIPQLAIYCQDCQDSSLYINTEKLISHHQEPSGKLPNYSFELDFCIHHSNMQNEFLCNDCDQKVCCYCIIESHSTHKRETLWKLTKTELDEFDKKKEDAIKVLKQLLACQKKLSELAECKDDSVKNQIHQYFCNLIAKMSSIEKQLCSELETNQCAQSDLEIIEASLTNHVSKLTELLMCTAKEKKVNLKKALSELRNVHEIPRFLVSDDNVKNMEFFADPLMEKYLEQAFTLNKPINTRYKLISKNDLANDYEVEKINNEIKSLIGGLRDILGSKKSKDVNKNSGKVIVQHINSTESFFIHLKEDQSILHRLNDIIENYVKVGCSSNVKEPLINGLYLALYKNTSGQQELWRRARVANIMNNDDISYEMFFIDYGMKQTVDISSIRELPSFLVLWKPLAIECKLHNNRDITWNKNDHYTFGTITKNKEVYMFIKCINNGLREVDLMVDSSDGGIISVIDIFFKNRQLTLTENNSTQDSHSLLNRSPPYKNIVLQSKIFPNTKKFTKNQQERVVIANITDPYNVTVHLEENKSSFNLMCKELKMSYNSVKNEVCIPLEGTYVIAEYKDPIRLNYHRAFIKHTDLTMDQVCVYLVDWGCSVIVRSDQLRPLPQQLTKLECLAVSVKMAHIAPYNKENTWHESSNKLLQLYYNSQTPLKMVVHELSPQLSVALFDISDSVDLCVNSMMVENNLADSTGNIASQLEWPRLNSSEPDLFEEDCFFTTLLKKAISDPDSEDELEKDKTIERRQLQVLKVESPDAFWIKFLSFSERDSKMYKELQIHYNQEQIEKEYWDVDEMCVVELEKEYTRGKIVEVLSNDYKVNLYDKAEDVYLPKNKIFIYNKYFMTYPPVAIKGHLANINPAGDTGKWSITSIESLQKILHKHKRIYGTIENETDASRLKKKSLPLHLWYSEVIQGGPLDPDITNFYSINKIMIKLGFAYKIVKTVASPKLAKTEDHSLKNLEETEELKTENITGVINTCCINSINSNSSDSELFSTEDLTINEIEYKEIISPITQNSSTTTEGYIDSWLPPFQLTKKEFYARVTCVETGGHLFIRDENMNKLYEKMQANIKEYFDNNPPQQQSNNWKADELCTIKYDGNWYRGRVLKVNSNFKISVFMIDFGSDHEVSPDVLYKEILYTEYNSFATKVKLDQVYSMTDKWLLSDYDNFHSLITDWCKIIVIGPLEVELPLVDVYTSDGVYINNKLVDICPNLSRNAILLPTQSMKDTVDIELTETETSIGIFEENEYKYLSRVYKQPPIPEEMLEGKMVILEVAGFLSHNKVILKIPGDNISPNIFDLIIKIQNVAELFPPLKDIQLNQPCLAKFSEDGIWYRGRISNTDNLNFEEVDVLYVDYGNVERLALENIRSIPIEFLEEPQQTWEAQLNIQNDLDTSDLLDQLSETLKDTNLLVKLVSIFPFTVDLYDDNGELCYNNKFQ